MDTNRPLSDKEGKILKRDLLQLDKNKYFQLKFLTGWILLAIIIGTFVSFRLDSTLDRYLLIGTVIIYILIGFWGFTETYVKQSKLRKNIDFVFSANKVRSIEVTSTDYIELSEVEDEGVHYLFQLTDNKILSFGGQDFYPTKKFPSDRFEIAICYGQRGEIVLLEVNNLGNKIHPKRTITGQKKWDLIGHANYPNPDNFTVIEGQLENMETVIYGG